MSSTTNNPNSYIKLNVTDNSMVADKLTNNSPNNGLNGNSKYKNHIMEKYLRGLDCTNNNNKDGGVELSKWIESAANFTPDKNNYIEWDTVRYKLGIDKILIKTIF